MIFIVSPRAFPHAANDKIGPFIFENIFKSWKILKVFSLVLLVTSSVIKMRSLEICGSSKRLRMFLLCNTVVQSGSKMIGIFVLGVSSALTALPIIPCCLVIETTAKHCFCLLPFQSLVCSLSVPLVIIIPCTQSHP